MKQNQVSFFFFLSHLSALSCIRSADYALHIRAVHQFLQDAKLLFGAGRHQILPFLRQDGQVCNVPLYILLPVGTGRRKFHQMPDTPTYKIAVALKVAILPPMHT